MTNIPNRLNLLTLLALQLGLSNTASCDCPQYSVRWTSLILMRCSSLTSFDVYLQPFFSDANEWHWALQIEGGERDPSASTSLANSSPLKQKFAQREWGQVEGMQQRGQTGVKRMSAMFPAERKGRCWPPCDEVGLHHPWVTRRSWWWDLLQRTICQTGDRQRSQGLKAHSTIHPIF